MPTVRSSSLYQFTVDTFERMGFPSYVAQKAAEVLQKADLRGIDSHGVARLSGYVRLVREGRINPNAQPEVVHETPSTANLNGDSGLGLWVAAEAMNIAIKKAEQAGSGWVAVHNSSHFGIAAAHAEQALAHDMIGFALTNASPLVAPAGGQEAYLGTNPICYAVPAGKYPPFIADLATSAVSNGKLEIASRKDVEIPNGWAQTKEGAETHDPNVLKIGGTLRPLGSDWDHSMHKGYALGATVDILTGVLSGANFGRWVPPFVSFLGVGESVGRGIGHFVGAWRVDAFMPAEEFKARMDKWIEGVKETSRQEGCEEIIIPGEPEWRTSAKREEHGIPLSEKVWEDLSRLSEELKVNMPEEAEGRLA